jgi:hypothetical protein
MSNRKVDKSQSQPEQQEEPKLITPEEPELILPEGPRFIDPFDNLDEHAGNQDYIEQAGVVAERLRVPVGRRNKQMWVRVNPDPAYRKDFAVLELKGGGAEKEFYLVSGNFAKQIEEEISWRSLYLGVTRAGTPFVWPIRVPRDRKDTWAATERECAEKAMKGWVRVVADMESGCFQPILAPGIRVEPVWPQMSFNDILKIAFQGDIIMSFEHPAVKELLGLGD